MGASASSIRAGEAFVEIYVKNNMLTRGLQQAGEKLSSFGKFADGLVAKAAGLAGLVATPVLGALKEFTDLGKELVHGSERLGTTVEQLDALRYAAEQAGVGADTLETAVMRLNRATADTPDALQKIGLNADEFAGMGLEEKLGAVADKIQGLRTIGEKTSAVMAIFGRGGAALLPMFEEGSEGIKKATEEAQRLGLVMSGDDARKAMELGKAFERLKAVIHRTFISLGAALLPVFENIKRAIDEKIGNLQSMQQVIRNNSGIITSALKVAKTVLKVAAAWLALRFALTQAGNVLSLASMGLSAVGAVLGFLLSPLGLVLLAVGGLTALFLTHTEAGKQFTSDLGAAFGGMGDRFKETWGGIKDALRAGDLGLAARIAWTEVQAEAMRVWKPLRLAWSDVIDFFGDGWDSLIYLLESAWNGFADFFKDVGRDMARGLAFVFLDAVKVIQDNTRELRAWLERRGITTFKDLNTKGMERAIAGDAKKQDEAEKKARDERDKALSKELDKKREARKEARDEEEADLDREIGALDAKLRELRDEARRAAEAVRNPQTGVGVGNNLGGIRAGVLAAAGNRGTFSDSPSSGRAFFLGNDIQKQQLDELKAIRGDLDEIADKGGGMMIGQ